MWYLDSQPLAGPHEPVGGRGRRACYTRRPRFVRLHAGMVRLGAQGVRGAKVRP